jgi:hypothetical protein
MSTPLRILFVADGRSPIAVQWMQYFVEAGHEVHLASTFECAPDLKLASLSIVPVAYSAAAGAGPRRGLRRLLPAGLRTAVRNLAGPLTLTGAAEPLRTHIASIQPDLVHALRIPYEGMLAAAALGGSQQRFLVSVWGNDFTLHARSPLMAAATRRTLRRADGLLADVQRDLALATSFGFDASKPKLLVPGNGGVRGEIFHPAAQPASEPRIINPRGLRAYVRNDVFFEAIARASKQIAGLQVDCPAMAGEPQAEAWVCRFGLGRIVNLLPSLPPGELAEAYRRSAMMVSPATHDGTPNTLLEAMASGLLPVAGDLDSIREWITDGENGLLVDPSDASALSAAIVRGLQDGDLRARAATMNAGLIAQRADYASGIRTAEVFYREVMAAHV